MEEIQGDFASFCTKRPIQSGEDDLEHSSGEIKRLRVENPVMYFEPFQDINSQSSWDHQLMALPHTKTTEAATSYGTTTQYNEVVDLLDCPQFILPTDVFDYIPCTRIQQDYLERQVIFPWNVQTEGTKELPSLNNEVEGSNSLDFGSSYPGVSPGNYLNTVDWEEMSQLPFKLEANSTPTEEISLPQLSQKHSGSEQAMIEMCCDTCFGAIEVTGTYSSTSMGKYLAVPVTMSVFGDIIRLSSNDTNVYLGFVLSPALSTVLREFNIKFVASIIQDQSKKSTKIPNTSTRECRVRIVVFGLKLDEVALGELLSEAGIYLQQPSAEECDRNVQYSNPHYLVRPGNNMPNLDKLSIISGTTHSTAQKTLDEVRKNRLMELFDCANNGINCDHITPSARLISTLKKHQLSALSMMLEKECGVLENPLFPALWVQSTNTRNVATYRHCVTGHCEKVPTPVYGGILADEMGLGKTLSILALICSALDLSKSIADPSNGEYQFQTTLIVTPKSTIHVWQHQIKSHIFDGQVRVAVFHGANRQKHLTELENIDILLTTYETLRADYLKNGALSSRSWSRLVLDEAHHIRNRSSQVFKAACSIRAQYRWCLTGTPIHNSLDDYGALLAFIGVHSLASKNLFDFWITSPVNDGKALGMTRLQTLVKATCLRRTKDMVKQSLDLPKRTEQMESIKLGQTDRDVYNFFKTRAMAMASKASLRAAVVSEFDEHGGGNLLTMITFLRLICNHGKDLLPSSAVQLLNSGGIVSVDWDIVQKPRNTCSLCNAYMGPRCQNSDKVEIRENCDQCEEKSGNGMISSSNLLSPSSREPDLVRKGLAVLPSTPSAKVEALIRNLVKEQYAEECLQNGNVIKSYWTKMLDLIQHAVQSSGFCFQRLDGNSSLEKRSKAITEFNEDPNCTVMLATIGSSGEGIDFTTASCVHLIEPHWNPMAEAQAVDRVHRIGQVRDVVITRYIVEDSVEEYVQWIQQDKLKLINRSLNLHEVSSAQLQNERLEVSDKTHIEEVPIDNLPAVEKVAALMGSVHFCEISGHSRHSDGTLIITEAFLKCCKDYAYFEAHGPYSPLILELGYRLFDRVNHER